MTEIEQCSGAGRDGSRCPEPWTHERPGEGGPERVCTQHAAEAGAESGFRRKRPYEATDVPVFGESAIWRPALGARGPRRVREANGSHTSVPLQDVLELWPDDPLDAINFGRRALGLVEALRHHDELDFVPTDDLLCLLEETTHAQGHLEFLIERTLVVLDGRRQARERGVTWDVLATRRGVSPTAVRYQVQQARKHAEHEQDRRASPQHRDEGNQQ